MYDGCTMKHNAFVEDTKQTHMYDGCTMKYNTFVEDTNNVQCASNVVLKTESATFGFCAVPKAR
jgi:hypothetical protein